MGNLVATAIRPDVSLVVPVHEEAMILAQALEQLRRVATSWGCEYEVVLCENGSRDGTLELARALALDWPQLRVFTLPRADYGRALRHGLSRSRGRSVAVLNIDFLDVAFVEAGVRLIEQGTADIVIGSKRLPASSDGRPAWRRGLTAAFNGLLRGLCGTRLSDTHGLKIFRADALAPLVGACELDAEVFDTELVLRGERLGLRIIERPVILHEVRPTRYSVWRRIPSTVRDLIRLTWTIRWRLPRQAAQRRRRFFYETIAERFDAVMNRYDLDKRLRHVFERGLAGVRLDGALVLDAGCGTGEFSRRAREAGSRLVSLDLGGQLVRRARLKAPGMHGVIGDVLDLPFAEDTFDVVICSETIEHTLSPRRAVWELGRVLKPGGRLVITAPNRAWSWALVVAQLLRARPYHGIENWVRRGELIRWVEDAGCRLERVWGFHLFPFILPATHRLLDACDRAGDALSGCMLNLAVAARKSHPAAAVDQRPCRIVRIVTRLNIGGPSVHAALLSTKLDPARFSTCLVIGRPDRAEGDLSGLVQDGPARVTRLDSLGRALRPWADAVSLLRLLRLTWRERPHIIHTHMAKAGALGRLAGFLYNRVGPGRRPGAGAVLIHTFHGHVLEGYFSPPLSKVFVMIERWLARRTDCLIAVSRTIRDDLLKKGIGREAQWRVIPLGVDLSSLADVAPADGSPPVRVGMVGRLVPIKNPSLLLEAFRQLASQGLGHLVTGVVAGDGPLREELERQARRFGLEQVVEFSGWQRDLRSFYSAIDIACLTSWNEGTPLALIEAMAAGRPVVATDAGGVRDLLAEPSETPGAIEPGRFQITQRGILVRPGDAQGLAAGLEALARDGSLRRRLGSSGRTHALHTFSHHRLLHAMTGLYDALGPQRVHGNDQAP